MSDHLLAIDVGTQSVRALIFDQVGEMLACAQVPIEAYFSKQPGWAEQHAQLYWDSIGQACEQLWVDHRPASIAGLSLTTQRATSLCIGADDRPLRPAVVWLDQRRATSVPPVGSLWSLAFRLARVRSTVDHFQHEAEANWHAENEPELWKMTRRFVLLSGYLSHRLTGDWVDSAACQVGYLPFDFKTQDWAAERDWKWQALPIRREQLCELVPAGQHLGRLTSAASQHLGLPTGVPIIAAAADKACEVLGAGCIGAGLGALSFGTTATINACTPDYREAEPFMPPYPAALPGSYLNEIQIYRGFWMVSWFKQQFAHREMQVAEQRGIAPEELFDALLADVPPGAMGLMLQPYWSPGVRDPGPEAKGAIIGFGDVHHRGHIYRAILEGLAYGLREGAEKIERRVAPIERLRVAGGGSQSRGAMQLTADIFGRTAERPHVFETSGLGAAMVCAVGLGLHADFTSAVAAMTRVRDVFEPDPDNQYIYEQLYQRVYRRMYRRLRPLYRQIKAITGYPPD